MSKDSQKGRKLHSDELQENVVYLLEKLGRPSITMWCTVIDIKKVIFSSGIIKLKLILFRKEDGTLMDYSGLEIGVYEYLGKV